FYVVRSQLLQGLLTPDDRLERVFRKHPASGHHVASSNRNGPFFEQETVDLLVSFGRGSPTEVYELVGDGVGGSPVIRGTVVAEDAVKSTAVDAGVLLCRIPEVGDNVLRGVFFPGRLLDERTIALESKRQID